MTTPARALWPQPHGAAEHTVWRAGEGLEQRGVEIASAACQQHADNSFIKRVTRVRRPGPFATSLVDRLPAPESSLADYLSHQLRMDERDPHLLALADWIVWNLEPDGYLREDLEDLGAVIGAAVTEMKQALSIVQSLDPTGVGARSLRECLSLQLQAQPDPDPVAVALVDRHLKDLADRRYENLAREFGYPPARIATALFAIRRLDPRPGRLFGAAPAQIIRVEAAIEKHGDQYRVALRDDAPCISAGQRSWTGAAAERREPRCHLSPQLADASRLITALERRRLTIRGVVESIARRQAEFLDRGAAYLRPLLLRQVAADVGVHESTVSRAVAHRYVETPHGVFPLRAFFSNRLPGDPAGVVCASAARQRIRELVDDEDASRPLTDGQITRGLAATGIHVARRTVVKYRERLGIAAAPQRRAVGV